jgi:hypothetical protein
MYFQPIIDMLNRLDNLCRKSSKFTECTLIETVTSRVSSATTIHCTKVDRQQCYFWKPQADTRLSRNFRWIFNVIIPAICDASNNAMSVNAPHCSAHFDVTERTGRSGYSKIQVSWRITPCRSVLTNLLLGTEDENNTILRGVGDHLLNTTQHPRNLKTFKQHRPQNLEPCLDVNRKRNHVMCHERLHEAGPVISMLDREADALRSGWPDSTERAPGSFACVHAWKK